MLILFISCNFNSHIHVHINCASLQSSTITTICGQVKQTTCTKVSSFTTRFVNETTLKMSLPPKSMYSLSFKLTTLFQALTHINPPTIQSHSTALIIKKLRYFARFIVVCLLLNRSELINRLMEELTELVDAYALEFKPSDSGEWATVLSEISTFLEAERKLSPTDLEGKFLTVSGRLSLAV